MVILNTVRYFDLFDQPVTATQLWQWQVGADRPRTLLQIHEAAQAAVGAGALATQWGYYYVPGRGDIVQRWLRRHALAQQKWKLTRRIARWLTWVPFVRMLAMSGSLAAGNTRSTSDLDIFVIAKSGRIWLARLGLLVVAQLLGRRRRHWDRQAPDKVCLNHYVTDTSLLVAPEIRNLYTAVLYRSLLCLTGRAWGERFLAVNQGWIDGYVRSGAPSGLASLHELPVSSLRARVTHALEALGQEPLWDTFERAAEWLQRRYIGRHTEPGGSGRVVVSRQELAFHPHSKVPGLLEKYYAK